METSFVDRRRQIKHVCSVPAPTVEHYHRGCRVARRDKPAVQFYVSRVGEPDLLLRESQNRRRLMDLSLGRSPSPPEERRRGRDNSGSENEGYRDALAHGGRIGTRRDTEYCWIGVVTPSMDTETLLQERKHKDEFFKLSPQSPIPNEDRDAFNGLAYFEPNPELVFTVRPTPVEPKPVTIETTTGEARTYHRIATATVDIHSTDVTLALYSTGHDSLFLPFRDATSGKESYGAGRYLDIEPDDDGSIVIDFNYAYAPFCAYSDRYSCALPPTENWVKVSIDAGERNTS